MDVDGAILVRVGRLEVVEAAIVDCVESGLTVDIVRGTVTDAMVLYVGHGAVCGGEVEVCSAICDLTVAEARLSNLMSTITFPRN